MARRAPFRPIPAVGSDRVGDVLLTGPAVRAPATVAPVTFLCGPTGRAEAALLPGVDSIIEHPCPWIDAARPAFDGPAFDQMVHPVRRASPDLAVVFTSTRQSPLPTALALQMAGVTNIVARSTDSGGALVTTCLRTDDDVHEVERNLALVEAAGVPLTADRRLRIRHPEPSPASDIAASTSLLSSPIDRRFVVVHPGAPVPARTLTAAQWCAVIRGLRRPGVPVAITGTDRDVVTRDVRRALSAPAGPSGGAPLVDLVSSTDLAGLARIIGDAGAICVGNTGPMHLAAAVGTPVAAVFPPTVPVERWRPWQVGHELLGRHGITCARCHMTTCPPAEQSCRAIEPDEVIAAVIRLLRGRALADVVVTVDRDDRAADRAVDREVA